MERKFKYNRFGLAENPVGKYVLCLGKMDARFWERLSARPTMTCEECSI